MKKNMGTVDRIIRIILAIVFVVIYLTGIVKGVFGIILLVLAGIFIITSILAFCPLYIPFKINTKK